MKQISTFILPLLVEMFIVSCSQIIELTGLSPTSENGEKIIGLKFRSNIKKRTSINVAILGICVDLFFNEFQF